LALWTRPAFVAYFSLLGAAVVVCLITVIHTTRSQKESNKNNV
jgi:hypothetical protein